MASSQRVGCVESSTTHRNSWPLADGHSEETRFDRVVVDNNFPDGYQVEVAIAYDFEINDPRAEARGLSPG